MRHYYYLHTNGDLISKPAVVADDSGYFDSPFVKKVWCIDTADRADAWTLVCEALALGADTTRCQQLAAKWGLTKDDASQFLLHQQSPPTEDCRIGFSKFLRDILKIDPDAFFDDLAKTKD
jgi:hypothetical protein